MRVLVSAASKYGSTAEVAEAIAAELREHGLGTLVREPTTVSGLDVFDAAVLGSGVYIGHWLDPAKELVALHADTMRQRPVWLFSVGPIGKPLKPDEVPVDVVPMLATTCAREHHIFAGCLDRSRLNFVEKAPVVALRAPEGDFRDWDEIREWARSVASALGGSQ